MNNLKKGILLAIAATFVAGAFLYPGMPDLMASHWGGNGQVNGYMPKFWALFLLPMVILAIYGLFIILPIIDPLKSNYKKFAKYYDRFLAVFVGFMIYIHALTILFNKGIEFNMNAALIPAMAALFYIIGTVLENTKQNWFIGIRTPWTLSSEKVWEKTNNLGAKIFKIIALLSLVLVFMGDFGLIILVGAIIIPSFYLIPYSYLEYKKEKQSIK